MNNNNNNATGKRNPRYKKHCTEFLDNQIKPRIFKPYCPNILSTHPASWTPEVSQISDFVTANYKPTSTLHNSNKY